MCRAKRKKKIGLIIGILLLIGAAGYYYRTEMVMANLDSRPFQVGVNEEMINVQPGLMSNHAENLVGSMVFEGLVYYDAEKQNIRSNIAEKWAATSDYREYTIHINNQIKLHNGQNINAAVIKMAWEKNLNVCKDWASVSLFQDIQGFQERLQGKSNEMTGLQVVDDKTLKIVLNEPNVIFMNMLTNPIFWIHSGDEQNPVGTGPFFIQEKDNKKVTLLRNESYHRGQPRLAVIEVTAYDDQSRAGQDYASGILDLLDNVSYLELQNLLNDETRKGQVINQPLLEIYALGFNLSQPPYKDNYYLRRALNYAVDRDAVIAKAFGGNGLALKGVIPQGVTGFQENRPGYHYDVEKAKNLLAEAGYPNGEGLPTLVLSYNDNLGQRMIVELVAEQLAAIGIKVQLTPLTWETYKKQLLSFQLSFFRLEWKLDYMDADSILYNLFHSSKIGMTNYSHYQNIQVDKLLSESRTISNVQERLKSLHKAEEIILDDAPYIWILQRKSNKIIGAGVREVHMDGLEWIDWFRVELHKPPPAAN